MRRTEATIATVKPTDKNKPAKRERSGPVAAAKYEVEVTFTEDLLGSSPKDKKVYETYIASKRPDGPASDEIETVAEIEERGWTGFHKDDEGIFLFDYQIRGFFKEALGALYECEAIQLKATKRKVNQYLFVLPRRVHVVGADGKNVAEPAGVIERPLRAETMQGPRVTLARSDVLPSGSKIRFRLVSQLRDIDEEMIRAALDRGEWLGMGQWRTGSYGRFTYTLKRVCVGA